jgi:uridine kinase
MSEVHRIVIQTRAPRGKDPGKVAEGYYVVVDGCVVLTDQAGKPLGSEKHYLDSDGDARLIACRILRRRQNASGSSGSFAGPIRYPKIGY